MRFSIIPAVRKPVVLITGAGGEIGHGLIERLASQPHRGIVTLDVARLDPDVAAKVDREITIVMWTTTDPEGEPVSLEGDSFRNPPPHRTRGKARNHQPTEVNP